MTYDTSRTFSKHPTTLTKRRTGYSSRHFLRLSQGSNSQHLLSTAYRYVIGRHSPTLFMFFFRFSITSSTLLSFPLSKQKRTTDIHAKQQDGGKGSKEGYRGTKTHSFFSGFIYCLSCPAPLSFHNHVKEVILLEIKLLWSPLELDDISIEK